MERREKKNKMGNTLLLRGREGKTKIRREGGGERKEKEISKLGKRKG